MRAYDRFRHDVFFVMRRATSHGAMRLLLDGRLDHEALAMVTLQMFHYVRHTVEVTELGLRALPHGAEHDEFRALLHYLAEDEAGHELIALADLERMGYDPDRCRETLPLPTTFNLPAENRFGVEAFGPYYLLGECYASETFGAEVAQRIYRAYARDPALVGCLRFYDVHGDSDVAHASQTLQCFQRYVEDPQHYRALLMGCVTASRNLMSLASEVQAYRDYPACFQLPPRRGAPA